MLRKAIASGRVVPLNELLSTDIAADLRGQGTKSCSLYSRCGQSWPCGDWRPATGSFTPAANGRALQPRGIEDGSHA